MIRLRMRTGEEFGLYLKTLRKSFDMTQDELAKAIGQSAGSIGMYENGKRMPDRETLEAIADVFNVGTQSLLFTEPVIDDVDAYLDALPQSDEAKIIAKGIDRMPPEKREQALRILQAAFIDCFAEETPGMRMRNELLQGRAK